MTSSFRQYKPRDQRPKNPKPICLMPRDFAVMRAVYEYRFLTSTQIQTLFFPSTHQAYARLALLYDHGFLDRLFLGVHASKMNTSILYTLDKRGAELLHDELELEVKWSSAQKRVGTEFLDHAIAINNVRVAIDKFCRESDDFELLEWRSDTELKAHYDRVPIYDKGIWKRVSLIPDSYFVLKTPQENRHFFLELDRGKMSLKRYKNKILAYLEYYKNGAYQKRYGTKSMRVLTVTLSPIRAQNLKAATEEAGGETRFWFTLLDVVTPELIITAPIWSIAKQDELFSLQDVPKPR